MPYIVADQQLSDEKAKHSLSANYLTHPTHLTHPGSDNVFAKRLLPAVVISLGGDDPKG